MIYYDFNYEYNPYICFLTFLDWFLSFTPESNGFYEKGICNREA